MKAIFIAFDQAHYAVIIEILTKLNARGFTAWERVVGRGSKTGIPHYGTHAWPSLNNAIFTTVEKDLAPKVLEQLRKIDEENPELGLRAFVWNIEDAL